MAEEDFVDRIYEAATIPEMWEGLLHDMSAEHGFEGGVLFTVNDMAQRGVFSPGVQEVFSVFLRDGWAGKSSRAVRTVAKKHAGFVRDDDLFAPDEADRDPLHVELLRPFGLGDVAGTVIDCPNGDRMAVSFERATVRGRTPDAAIQAFDALRPHIARAAVISGRIEVERARAQVSALSALGIPAAVLSGTGRALAANAGFEALDAQIEIRARDFVALRDRPAGKLFANALSNAGKGLSIPLPGAGDAPPAVLHVAPVRRSGRDMFPNASWLVAVTALGVTAPPASILGGLFDLSPGEARVAAGVLEGLTLADIAARHGASVATVRNQLASVFAKTGVSRQTELILLCGVGAAPKTG